MNQTKTGKFIAKCRKEKKLTQAQLAEKLNITDRAVSKWETIIAVLFTRVGKTRKCLALGIAFLSAIPYVFIVNTVLLKMIAEPIFDIWDMLTVFLSLIFAFIAFIFDYIRKKKKTE